MLVIFSRMVFIAGGGAAAVQLAIAFRNYWADDQAGWISALILAVLIFSGLGYVLGGVTGRFLERILFRFESIIHKHSTADIIVGFFGLLMGLVLAAMLSLSIRGINFVGAYLPPLVFVVGGYMGLRIAMRRREEFRKAFYLLGEKGVAAGSLTLGKALPKIIDTSIIIDGRLVDICRSGFIEGELIVPMFVLQELQALADSQDAIKRARGRRGLDLLRELQQEAGVEVKVLNRDADPGTVDNQLVKLAQETKGALVTKDFNLQKIAELSGVKVLNVNQLANAVKSVVVGGEELRVGVIKLGKEADQGVGYLEDGTMVVVEGGSKFIGEQVEVVVTSVLQTASGRLIFSRPVIPVV